MIVRVIITVLLNIIPMSKKILGIIIIVTIVVIVILNIPDQQSKNDLIKIGYFGPFTGLLAQSTGESVAEGFKLAEAKRNTIDGSKIKVIYEDDGCDPKKAVSAAQKLIDIDKVKILVSGVCSSATLAVAPIAEKNHIVLISPTSASPKITSAGDYIFRLSSPTTGMAQKAVDYLATLGYTKVAVLFENNEYPAGWKDSFITLFKGEATVEGVAPGSTDVKSQLLKLSQTKPQAYVLVTISPGVASIALKQFKELGLKGTIVANDTFSLKVVHQLPDADGVVVVTYTYDLAAPLMVNFLADYKKKYGREAKEEIYAALGNDT
jgi:branched-chain amino acid transport system substrate-binding protein